MRLTQRWAWRPAWHGGIGLAGLALAWLAGVALQMQQAALFAAAIYTFCGLAGLAVTLALWWRATSARLAAHGSAPSAFWPWALAWLASAAIAFGSTGWRAERLLAQRLQPMLEGADLVVIGSIEGLPQRGSGGTRFVLAVESASWNGQAVALPSRLSLGWYAAFDAVQWLDAPSADLGAGQRWQLPVRLKQPHGLMNPHGFDAELWSFSQGLGAQGHVRVVRGGPVAQLLDRASAYPVDRWRDSLRAAIWRQVADSRVAGVLAALVVGDQAAIERADWELFRQTGIAHLVSISGLHVTMFAWLAAMAVGAAWRCWPRAMLWCAAPVAGRWGGVLLATAYALLAGWGVPAQRTVLMLATVAVLRQANLNWPWPLVLLTAAVAVTALDPWALLQAGFWLSFAAVGLLMASEPVSGAAPAGRLAGKLAGELRGQWVATLGLAPLSLLFFQQLSVVGLLANLVAIPVVTFLITPLALLGGLASPLWTLAGALVQALVVFLTWLAGWPGAVWHTAAAPIWAVASGLLGAVVAVLPWPWQLRWLALPLLLPMLAPAPTRPAMGQFELVAADVGQGTAVLIRTRSHLLVFDSGPAWGLDSDAGQRVLMPLLRARGERRIDELLLSHSDSDHVGGASALMAGLPVGRLRTGLPVDHALHHRGVPALACETGQRWLWDGVQFEILYPSAQARAAARKPNAMSCVLRVQDALGRSALLTADIEAAQEAALVQLWGPRLASTVLLVPHHGSRTSSGAAFLAAVQPEVAVVQAGYRSRYGHPAPDVVARYRAFGIALVRSDHCGAWSWQDGAQLCARSSQRRYWHWRAVSGETEVAEGTR